MILVLSAHETADTNGVLQFEDWCIMVYHHTTLLGIDVCLTGDYGQLQVGLGGAYRATRAIRQQACHGVYLLIQPAVHQMARSFLLLKLHAGLYAEAPIRLMLKVDNLTIIERLVHHLAPFEHGKDVILVNIEEFV